MGDESITVSDADIDAAWESDGWTDAADTSEPETQEPETQEPEGGAEPETPKPESGAEPETAKPETQEQAPEQTAAQTAAKDPQERARETEQLIEIADGDGTRRVTRSEAAELAAKGLKYDAQAEKLTEYEDFVNDLAKASNSTAEAVMESVRASLIAKRDKISKEAALDKVRLNKRERDVERREKKLSEGSAKDESDKRRQADFAAFVRDYKDVQAKDIPREVWDAVRKGESLSSAYAKYDSRRLREENKALKDELETAKKNAANRERSAGSAKGSGKPSRDSVIDEVFAED